MGSGSSAWFLRSYGIIGAMTARPMLRFALIAIVAFALGLFLARAFLSPREVPVPATESATILPQARELPPLDLVDQDNRPLPRDFLRDRWTLVFFGFTQCPDVCPTTLTTLAQMKQRLADLPAAQQPRVLLVSVDPERDTAEILAPYVRFFDPHFMAARGSLEATAAVAAAFTVPYAKVPLPDGGYTNLYVTDNFNKKLGNGEWVGLPVDATGWLNVAGASRLTVVNQSALNAAFSYAPTNCFFGLFHP